MLSLPSRTVRIKRSDPRIRVTAPDDALPAASPPTAATSRVNVSDHPVVQHALTTLRDEQTSPHQFRAVSNQLLVLLAMEATRFLPTRETKVETAHGAATGQLLAKPVVFLSISRHGLGLAHQVTDFFPDLIVGAISLDRANDGPSPEARLHLVNAPALSDAHVILFDPIVASGLTACVALNLVRRAGATSISLVSFLVSFQGLTRVQAALPDLTLWTAAIDSDWDSKRGPMPGVGDFAERLYG